MKETLPKKRTKLKIKKSKISVAISFLHSAIDIILETQSLTLII